MSAMSSASPQRRVVLAWAMYDWANSAYSTLSITILLAYIQFEVFPTSTSGSTGPVVWAWGISLSMLVAAILSPILGALADAHATKAAWLRFTALAGAAFAVALAMVPPHFPWLIACLFVITAFFFELSLTFYNAFLPEIADERSMDRVSAWGFALGYIGGGLALICTLPFLRYGPQFGLDEPADQFRAGILLMGLWWAIFSLPAILILRDRKPRRTEIAGFGAATGTAISEVRTTLTHIRAYRTLAWFLLGFLFYNDGVQTVISQASTFAKNDLNFSPMELVFLVLLIQFLAFPGALLCGYLSERLGRKPTLIATLLIWIALLVAAYLVQTKEQFWVLGAVVALVLGGVQSVSRAIVGLMTPPQHAAEVFGFFNLSGKATSFMGTFLFGAIVWTTGSARLATLSLIVQFMIGLAIILPLSIRRGQIEARTPEGSNLH